MLGRKWHYALLGLLLLAGALTLTSGALAQSRPTVIFLHHSCGLGLIDEGNVREGLTARGYDFYDHGYNEEGLRLADGSYSDSNFDVPDDNTDPGGFAEIFSQPLHDPPDNTFSHLMQYDVIAFKSCFPVSNIADEYQLEEYEQDYLTIRARMDQHPEKAFIIVTQPPQVPGASDRQEADRAHAWTQWLQSAEFLAGYENVFVFDFFDALAGDDNFLRREYRYDNYDAHPNARANGEIGPRFVEFIDQVAQDFEPGATVVVEEGSPEDEETPVSAPPVAPSSGAVDLSAGAWEADMGGGEVTVQCGVDPATEHNGAAVVRMTYEIAEDAYGDCGQYFDDPQNWDAGEGFGIWLQIAEPGQIIFTVFSGSSEAATPFEVFFDVSGGDVGEWRYFYFPWTDFELAQWADTTDVSVVDPTRILGYGFTLDAYGESRAGTLLLDVVGPTTAEGAIADAPAPIVEAPSEAEVEPEDVPVEEEPESGGGICPGAMALPAIVGGVGLVLRKRRCE